LRAPASRSSGLTGEGGPRRGTAPLSAQGLRDRARSGPRRRAASSLRSSRVGAPGARTGLRGSGSLPRRPKPNAGSTRLGKADGDGLFRGTCSMLAAPDVLHLFMDELPGLCRRSHPPPFVTSRTFDRRFLRHLYLLGLSRARPGAEASRWREPTRRGWPQHPCQTRGAALRLHVYAREAITVAGRSRNTRPRKRRWSRRVTETSNALTLEQRVFAQKDPNRIALSLKRSADRSRRRKSSSFRSAMSMLNFYVNRAGRKLPVRQRARLERAKVELREVYGRSPRKRRSE